MWNPEEVDSHLEVNGVSVTPKIFVSNYGEQISENFEKEFVRIFGKYGKIICVRKTVHNFTYVTFSNKKEAYRALQENGKLYYGKRLRVECSSTHVRKLVVENLPADYLEDEIEAIFGKYGKIKKINQRGTNVSIIFEAASSIKAALVENGTTYDGHELIVKENIKKEKLNPKNKNESILKKKKNDKKSKTKPKTDKPKKIEKQKKTENPKIEGKKKIPAKNQNKKKKK
eukprot:gene11741-5079_t